MDLGEQSDAFYFEAVEDGEEGEHQYRLLGEAYVHGIMHRELFLDKTEDEKPKFEKLIIIWVCSLSM
jgi:hypothetical protein